MEDTINLDIKYKKFTTNIDLNIPILEAITNAIFHIDLAIVNYLLGVDGFYLLDRYDKFEETTLISHVYYQVQ